MQHVPEHVRYMVEKLATPVKDIRRNQVSRMQTKTYPLHEVVGTMITFILYKAGNMHELPEGIYIRTNRDIAPVRKDPFLQKRITDAALAKLKNPDHPDTPLEAHFHEGASAQTQKATFKIGPPEENQDVNKNQPPDIISA